MPTSNHKRTHGQFFTIGNPFVLRPFQIWFDRIPLASSDVVLEPFAGANHLVRLMREAGHELTWSCHDLHPSAKQVEGVKIHRRNTLVRFPRGHRLAITNPPYLARNSATRRGLEFPVTAHDDVYKHALAVALEHVDYLAAIVPESFLTAGVLTQRLEYLISIPWPMFDDTEHPVCLALFSPGSTSDFEVFSANKRLGWHSRLAGPWYDGAHPLGLSWRFNDPAGSIGLRGVDGHRTASIAFVPGNEIAAHQVKPTSRALTRISWLPKDLDVARVLSKANELLVDYRRCTHDVLLTPFKGLRTDGHYRRRLDFSTARVLLDRAVQSTRKRK